MPPLNEFRTSRLNVNLEQLGGVRVQATPTSPDGSPSAREHVLTPQNCGKVSLSDSGRVQPHPKFPMLLTCRTMIPLNLGSECMFFWYVLQYPGLTIFIK